MDMLVIGRAIKKARENGGFTQERLAEQIGVLARAVSKWENGKNLPDIENLLLIAEVTDTPYHLLLTPDREDDALADVRLRTRLFHEDNMYTRMKTFAIAESLTETYRALQYMRTKHMGQFRKQGKFTHELVQYINHPLMMACQAHAFGIRDDMLLSALLLHDVVEDTGVTLEELPFSDEVKELVGLVTFSVPEGKSKHDEKEAYYKRISKNGKACVIKCIDRCNNVSTMSACFSREKIFEYIDETETYIIPLTDILKNEYPEYSDLAFLVKYHMLSIIETVKNLIIV